MKKTLIFSLLFLLTGCFNYNELNELAIASAIGISKFDNQYKIYIEVINTSKESGSEEKSSNKFTVFETSGNSISEALKKASLESPHNIYYSHLSLLIVDDIVAREGLNDIIDLFARNNEFRNQFYVVTSKNNEAKNILNTITGMEKVNAKSIIESISTNNKLIGVVSKKTFEDILKELIDDKKELTIPNLILVDNKILLDETAIFKGDKLVGYLDNDESINLSFITNNINRSFYDYECGNNRFTNTEIINSSTDIKNKNNIIDINIKMDAYLSDNNCYNDLEKNSQIEKLEKKIGDDISTNINSTIDKVIMEYNSDIFGFYNIIYKNNPRSYYMLKEKYKDYLLSNLDFNIKVNINLVTKGNIIKEFKNE